MSYLRSYKRILEKYLNVKGVSLFWKGRVALYAILKALGIGKGNEVILPAFTCVVVPNALIYLGAKPVYVDVNPQTFNMDVEKIEEKITPKTKVILAQNTFGLSSDLDKIREVADRHGLWVVEDCAHGFGGTYKGCKNGTVADAAFFSTQWNKPFSTGLGGIAVAKDTEVAQRLKELEIRAVKPSKREELMLKALLSIREKLVSSDTYWLALKTYRFLSQKNIIVGSSQGYELERPVMPDDFLKGFTQTQAKKGLEYFQKVDGKYRIDLIIRHRKRVANHYKKMLTEFGLEPPYEPDYAEHTYLRFPLLVKDRKKFFHLAEKEKVELGDWFMSPIHPVQKNFELWGYSYGENPIAEFASGHIVNLPTHEKVGDREMERIYSFLKKNKDEIIGCRVPI